jgi:HD superfamily phosphohydrolase
MTGADLVALDRDRIISAYCAHGGWLTLSSKALSTITGLVHGRNALYAWVYNHHAVVYTEAICERYLLHLREECPAVQQLFSLDGIAKGRSDDTDVWTVMKSSAASDPLSRWYADQVLGRLRIA